jgi:hypothetical protein
MKAFALLFLLASGTLLAQEQYFRGATYNPAVPKSDAVLGYELGTRFSDFRNLERYFQALLASSDRIQRIEYGRTYEDRPLQVFAISSPSNLARLSEIKSNNLKLSDPRLPNREKLKAELLETMPALVWLSYGVHGNESSSPEAAMMTAYQLCAGTDARTKAILDNVVIVLDPSVNPDGRERYVGWVNSMLGREPNNNPDALEHHEPWPGGRVNHYYFDLNRDWSWATQRETQARLRLYRQWMPHVHVDFHEMGYGSTYFFFPAAPPFHTQFPEEVKKWGAIYGKGNADAFDAYGIPYYTGESFDLFYPGYGDSWPTFNGAVGMTYEQAGHSMGGLAIRKPGGEILTLRERVRNHFISGMATLETTVKNKKDRLKDFASFWESGLKRTGPVQTYVIRESPDPARSAQFVSLLLQQGIEVHRLQQSVQMSAKKFFSGKSTKETFLPGTYFVSLQQPNSRLASALLEPAAAAQDTFFYDVSAWSLPVAYGLDAYGSESPLPSGTTAVHEPPVVPGSIVGGKAIYAYLIPWERSPAPAVAWQLLERGFRLSYASRPLNFPDRTYRAGTVIAFVHLNPDSIHNVMESLARTNGIDIFSTSTGLTEKGIDLGSNYVRPLLKPSIAVVTGDPVDPNDYGELWYMFDQEYGIPFTALSARTIGNVRLDKYSVIVLPNARNYGDVLDSADVGKLKNWVREGGILVGIEGGAQFMTRKRSGLTPAMLETDKKEEEKSKEEKERQKALEEQAKRQSLFEKEQSDRRQRIPGTIFKALIDTTHPIGFGYGRETFVFKGNNPTFQLSEAGHTVARFSTDTTSASGYAPLDRTKRIADSGFILDFRVGSGRVVMFAENITFRMFWKGHQRLLMNAFFFLPQRG